MLACMVRGDDPVWMLVAAAVAAYNLVQPPFYDFAIFV